MLPNVFGVLVGLDVTDEWGQVCPHYLPISLQIAPIDYVMNMLQLAPICIILYIYLDIKQKWT